MWDQTSLEPEPRGEAADVLQEQPGCGGCGARKAFVQRVDEARTPARGGGVEIAEDGAGWQLEVVLNDGAAELPLERTPNLLEARELEVCEFFELRLRGADRGKALHVHDRGVDVDDVGFEADKSVAVVDCVDKVAAVLGLMEGGAEACLE